MPRYLDLKNHKGPSIIDYSFPVFAENLHRITYATVHDSDIAEWGLNLADIMVAKFALQKAKIYRSGPVPVGNRWSASRFLRPRVGIGCGK